MARDYDRSEIPSAYDLREAPPAVDEPGFRQVVFRGIDQMIGFSEITAEYAESDPHTHPFEQLNMLIEGRIVFIVDGERLELAPYDTLSIPPGIAHTTRTVDDESATLLACWPLREDRLDGTDYQREFPSL